MSEGKTIRIDGIAIEVPEGTRPQVDSDATGSRYALVQRVRPLSGAQLQMLRDLGAEPLEEVAGDTYIVRFDGVDLRLVLELEFVGWAAAYRPEFRLAPELRRENPGRHAGELLRVRVRFQGDIAPAEGARALRSLAAAAGGRCLRVEKSDESTRSLVLRLPVLLMDSVAGLDAVRSVTPA